MSASSMANVAVQRAARGEAQRRARGGNSTRAPAGEGEDATGFVAQDNAFTAAMSAVTTYIPTDVLTLYVAGSAIFLGVGGATSIDYDRAWAIFVGGLIATPLVNILVFLAKLRSAGVAIPRTVRNWPIWECVAATIAFVFWAAALPATPFADFSWYDAAFAGFLLGVASLFLGLISSIIMPTATKPAPAPDTDEPAGP